MGLCLYSLTLTDYLHTLHGLVEHRFSFDSLWRYLLRKQWVCVFTPWPLRTIFILCMDWSNIVLVLTLFDDIFSVNSGFVSLLPDPYGLSHTLHGLVEHRFSFDSLWRYLLRKQWVCVFTPWPLRTIFILCMDWSNIVLVLTLFDDIFSVNSGFVSLLPDPYGLSSYSAWTGRTLF